MGLLAMLFGVKSRDLPQAAIETLRATLIAGSSGDRSFERMIYRIISDDYRYIAGVVVMDGGMALYTETPASNKVQLFSNRSELERHWPTIEHYFLALIAADPATDTLPVLNGVHGWRVLHEPGVKREQDRTFTTKSLVSSVLDRAAGSHRLYVEYRERGVELYFDNEAAAFRVFNELKASTLAPTPAEPPYLRPKDFQTAWDGDAKAENHFTLGGIAALPFKTLYAWGGIPLDAKEAGWLLVQKHERQVVLPCTSPAQAQKLYDLYVAATTTGKDAPTKDQV